MKQSTKEHWCGFANLVLILTLILSIILIFIIKPWIVLVINVCVNVLYRILFFEMETAKWKVILQYVVMCIITIGLMLAIMLNLDKISIVLQHKSDMEYVYNTFGRDYLLKDPNKYGWKTNGVNTDKLIKYCYITSGSMMTILIVHHIICGLVLIFNYDGHEDMTGAFCLAFPLVSLGALIIFYCPFDNLSATFSHWSQIFRWLLSVGYIAVIEGLLYALIVAWLDRGCSSGGGSSSDEYEVIIIKH